jgi:para-aminobenzoate synthetase/4-amino-4-deoxychorismate lyase
MNRWHPLPHEIYSFVEKNPGSVLLESARPGSSCISRLFAEPDQVIEVRDLTQVQALFSEIEEAVCRGGFAAGYFAYECGEYFEPAATLRRPSGLLAWFGIYGRCIRFDHSIGAFLDPAPSFGQQERGRDRTSMVKSDAWHSVVDFSLDGHEFADRVEQTHEWIRAGDVYQLNFTFPIRVQVAENPAALFARLRTAQPVDYAAFVHPQIGRHVLSFSPELFFRVDQDGDKRRITTQPMKGTARRGRTTAEDREIAAWLHNDPKNRAENVMIVDLIRNDLGRICSFGSIRVENLLEVERYATLWQMTSTITGDLRADAGCEEILRALFPCGSVTGAPKVRAMQLLAAEIENEPRGVYTGAIGYFSRRQTVFNVAIRTLELENNNGTMGVGSGIVIDSDPETEYQECLLKAEFLVQTAEKFSLIETMRWDGEFRLLELHLDRLLDSAAYFDFPCDRAGVTSELLGAASEFTDGETRKVRLLLDAEGCVEIESERLTEQAGSDSVRVCMASQRTDPADRFLFHKTTRRDLYNAAFAAVAAEGFADLIFLNMRDEVTEGAISNIFVEKSGQWYTPPLECGVLPGVYRRHLLQTRQDVQEKILLLDDLKAADSVYICNAVRGLRRALIEFEDQESGS